ncbi:MAG: M23 family metallopeptidase [Patescibacteria group bacterium]
MEDIYQDLQKFGQNLKNFGFELFAFLLHTFHLQFIKFENHKGTFVSALYKQRGKLAQKLMHSSMAGIAALGVMIAPIIAQEIPGRTIDPWNIPATTAVLGMSLEDQSTATVVSDVRGNIEEYVVADGDTVSSIADKFGISADSVRWENDLTKDKIKVGQAIKILPVTGVSHKVAKGETVYSIAKRYDTEPQGIVNFPFNSFANDETFELAIGQTIIVPEGVKPTEVTGTSGGAVRPKQITPDAGTVVASGQFVWPTQGTISQSFYWYHPGIDIANRSLPAVLAADSGKIIAAGWDSTGYGNKVVIDHGNGYITLYAHLSKIYVVIGQTVTRGSSIGQVGSTGRSTGPHLHFEVQKNGVRVSPFAVLR